MFCFVYSLLCEIPVDATLAAVLLASASRQLPWCFNRQKSAMTRGRVDPLSSVGATMCLAPGHLGNLSTLRRNIELTCVALNRRVGGGLTPPCSDICRRCIVNSANRRKKKNSFAKDVAKGTAKGVGRFAKDAATGIVQELGSIMSFGLYTPPRRKR